MRQAKDGTRCQHVAASTQRQCASLLDPFLDHAVICKFGQGVYRLHNCLAQKVREFAREAGCEATCEVVVPSLTRNPGTDKAEEARLDVHIWASGAWPLEAYIDVTTRHPWAERYRQEALSATAKAPTAAERRATTQKESRYGQAAEGIPIIVAVLGSWGRLNGELLDLLDLLARRASYAREDSGVSASCRQRRWLEEIAVAQQRCLHRHMATACLAGCTPPSTAAGAAPAA